MKTLTVEELYTTKGQSLRLELLTPECGLKRAIQSATVSSPGLVLAGYMERAPHGRLMVLGETEMGFLRSLPPEGMRAAVAGLLSLDMPAIFVTKAQEVPDEILDLARARDVPVFCSDLKTGDLYRRIQPYLEEEFAPSTMSRPCGARSM